MDKSPKYIGEKESIFLLNNEVSVNPNGGANGGASLGVSTPMAANSPACLIEQPSGENYTILKYHSKRTEEAYSGIYNSNGVNWIQRINSNGVCEIVYQGDCLLFSADPKHSIEQFRCAMRVEKICKNWSGKELIWVDGNMVSPGCIDVEASTATNFFTTPFFDICPDPCAYIQLCVPEICGCITAQYITLLESELSLSNFISEKAFKFMVKHIYYDGRESEWSNFSSLYYQDGNCLGSAFGLSRCIKLQLPMGNPMVDKIVIAFSEDGGNTWYEYETIEKYKSYNNSQQQWYDRELSEITSQYNIDDCTFEYIFCNNKNRKTIDAKEVSRLRNPIPRKAQTLIQFTNKFAFFNYEDGVCPISKIEADKMNLEVECNDSGCSGDIVTVTVRAIIYRPRAIAGGGAVPSEDIFAPPDSGLIYRLGGENGQEKDNVLDVAYFDSTTANRKNSTITDGIPLPNPINQHFYDNVRNFIVYVEGTDYWAEMNQWKADPFFENRREVGVVPALFTLTQQVNIGNDLANGDFYYQEAVIKVSKGTRGFLRMVSHGSSDGGIDSQSTSQGIVGILNDIRAFKTKVSFIKSEYVRNDIVFGKQELFFDTCNGSVEMFSSFLVQDNSLWSAKYAPVYSGYIRDLLGRPVEGLTFPNPATDGGAAYLQYKEIVTDHNGFYSFLSSSTSFTIGINGEQLCNQWGVVKSQDFAGEFDTLAKLNVVVDDTLFNFTNNRFALVKVTSKDCDGNVLPNIKFAISGSKSTITDAFGVATFRVRNYKNKSRFITVVLANDSGCISQDCNGNCNPCHLILESFLPTCFVPSPTISLGTFTIRLDGSLINKNGLKPGGLYGFGIVAKGDCGRVSAVYELPQISIPKIQETLKFPFCKINYDATGMILPDWVNCLEIVRTSNLNGYELQWIVDDIERADGNIKITIQSLNDYNTRYFFKTNTIYQYAKGDRVEFISNNGQILDAATNGILNYLLLSPFYDSFYHGDKEEPADYFNQILIKDDGRLNNIKRGAIIEIQRPKQSTVELNPYFSICAVLETVLVNNGDGTFHTELLNPIGEFQTFDTYFIRRNIGGQTDNFQHHSPSDFWGTKQTDAGRAFFVNQYENEKRYGRYATINSPTQINRFGDLIKKFDGDEQGDITAANIVDDNILLLISEYDCSIAQTANDLLRIDNTGSVRAQPADAIISDPQAKPIGAYGCQYEHIGSVYFGDGFATWWDVDRMAFVKHNYNIAVDLSEGKVKTFVQKRSQQIEFLNKTTPNNLEKLRFTTGQNSQTQSIFITIKRLRDSGINNEKEPFLKLNDTLIFNPLVDEFLGFAGFTPEGYSNISLFDGGGCAFISYLNGIPYIHPVLATKWNEFYGVAVDWMVATIINQFQGKEKVFIAVEQQSEILFIADNVETDKAIFSSEIPAIKFKKFGRHYNAGFLANKNSKGGLFGIELPKGAYMKVLFIRDNTDGFKYQTIDNNKRILFSELDSFVVKFAISEESGLTENL